MSIADFIKSAAALKVPQGSRGVVDLIGRNVGTRLLITRGGAFANNTPKTFALTLELQAPYEVRRVAFVNYSTTVPYTVTKAGFVRKRNLSAPNISSGTLTPLLFAGSASKVIPVAPSAKVPMIVWSDWVVLPSVDRDDGKAGAVETLAAYIETASSISIMGNGTDDYTTWAGRTDGRAMIMRHNDGDCLASQGSFTSTTNRLQTPFGGLQYMARSEVRSVGIVGDSNAQAVLDTYIGSGFGERACAAIQAASGTAFEFSNFGYGGSTSAEYRDIGLNAVAALAEQPIDALLLPNYTVNDAGASPGAESVRAGSGNANRIAGECRRYGTAPIIYTGLPSDPGGSPNYSFGTADQWRQANNAATLLSKGAIPAAVAEAVEAPAVSGQKPYASGNSGDRVHLSPAGNALAAIPAAAAIRIATSIY